MVPAIAVETDLTPTRRTRRAASADITNTSIRPMRASGRSSHSEADTRCERARRTSYGDSADSASDSDANPYARKRFKSVRSAVKHAYPRRRREQVVDPAAAPCARRSASHSDSTERSLRSSANTHPDAFHSGDNARTNTLHSNDGTLSKSDNALRGSSNSLRRRGDTRRSSGSMTTGKWRSSYTSSEDEGERTNNTDSDHGSSRPVSRASSTRSEANPRPSAPADAMLLPPVPHTTPRASASPDQTPFPPTTSPTFHHFGDSDSGEMQAASPLLLPRSLMALPLDGGLFDAASPPGKDAIPSPADMSTPLVSAAMIVHSDDSVVPAHPYLLMPTPSAQ
ncbi:hypothetical protein GGF43_002243 [Coemansia sp. RSA 2618]|nr:hypothetical protein GGF43_002243 [Coemansia sp. RSA 2618]